MLSAACLMADLHPTLEGYTYIKETKSRISVQPASIISDPDVHRSPRLAAATSVEATPLIHSFMRITMHRFFCEE
jgi:hypothetical protein